MIHIYPAGVHLALDLFGFAVFVTTLCLVAFCADAAFRRRIKSAAICASLAVAMVGFLTFIAVPAPAITWPTILSAYDESSGQAKLQRQQDLSAAWNYGEVPLMRWLIISSRWGVCHGMWEQQNCRMPIGPHEDQGSARDILENVARGGPRYPDHRPASEWNGY